MINKSLILNKAIENVKNDYQLALAQNDKTNMAKHQSNLSALIQLQEQMRQSGELEEDIIQLRQMPKRGGK
ncbi:MAG: hypothetical protein OH335_04305 [Candidatus Parvarchaeota archaeon]|nr:hypothetical protein [Candidatus Jingweiarchaeum tengchongense]